jgi:hypothetical protein
MTAVVHRKKKFYGKNSGKNFVRDFLKKIQARILVAGRIVAARAEFIHPSLQESPPRPGMAPPHTPAHPDTSRSPTSKRILKKP